MHYVVLDMEWNQAATYAEMVKTPVFLTGEIIQIGAVKLDQDFHPVDAFNCRVTPAHYTKLHPHVAAITKLTDADLRKGEPFCNAFAAFCDWCGTDFSFLIWGTEDLRILRKNMDLYEIDTSYMPACYNLQNIFAEQISHDYRQYGLSRALSQLNETPFDAHDALNDAKSTVLVCKHLDLHKGLKEYTQRVDSKNGCVESYEFDELYFDLADALSDDYVISFECPRCGEIVWGENWARKKSTVLLGKGRCSDGQEYLIKLRFRPAEGGKVTVKRFVYEMTDTLMVDYQDCLDRAAAWSKYVIPAYAI